MVRSLQDELNDIGQEASEEQARGNDALTEAVRATTDPLVLADLVAAQIHHWMSSTRDTLCIATPALPTYLNHRPPSTVALTRGNRTVTMMHVIGDHRLYFGWGDQLPVNSMLFAVDARDMRNTRPVITAIASYLTGKAPSPFVQTPAGVTTFG